MGRKGSSKRVISKARRKEFDRLSSNKVANEGLGRAMMDKRSSNAAQPHIPNYRKGTRRVKQQRAIDEFF